MERKLKNSYHPEKSEKSGKVILVLLTKGDWIPFKFPKHSLPISHLFFANNILLFCKPTPNSLLAVNEVLNKFCSLSGLSINLEKQKIWPSNSVPNSTKQLIKNTFNIKQSNNLGLYLRYPLKPSYKNSNLKFILKKIDKKLQGWKSNLFSKFARLNL